MQKYELSKQIESNFNGINLSSYGGMLCIGEFIHGKIKLKNLLKKSIKQYYNPKKIKHSHLDVIIQEIFSIIAGYTTRSVDQYIKEDLVFKELLGKIVPKTTVNRIINTFGGKIKNALQKIGEEIERYNTELSERKEIIIDVDTSFDTASKNIGGVKFNSHYGKFCLSPILAFDGLTGDLIMGELRPGDWHCSRGALELIKKIVKLYRKYNIKIFFRLDSGFAIPEIYEYLEQENIGYTIKLKSNSCITKIAEKITSKENIKPGENKIFEFEYSAGSWNQKRRIICSLDWMEKETKESKKDKKNKKGAKQLSLFPNYSFIVTNNQEMSEQEVLSMYNGRATVETCIEEAKNGFGINRLSHKKFEVNQAMFQVHLLAMQISQIFRKHTIAIKKDIEEEVKEYTKQEYNGKFEGIKKIGRKMFSCPNIQTLRKILLEIPTRVTFSHRKRIFNFERTFGGKELYQKVMKRMESIIPIQI